MNAGVDWQDVIVSCNNANFHRTARANGSLIIVSAVWTRFKFQVPRGKSQFHVASTMRSDSDSVALN